MNIKFQSTVIITDKLDEMKEFYTDILKQEIEVDFGTCIGFKNGFSLWKLTDDLTVTQKLGRTFDKQGNKNIELCFETTEFELVVKNLKKHHLNYLHEVIEEPWGQQTMRFFDPENNLVEIGETIPCFVKRFYNEGMSIDEVAKRTSVPVEFVKQICETRSLTKND